MSRTVTASYAQTLWKQKYPNIPFPTPQQYPQMFDSGGKYYKQYTDYVDPNSYNCTAAAVCPKGLMDYKCQIQHQCYINLAQLFATLLGFALSLIIFFLIASFLIRLIYKILSPLVFLPKLCNMVKGCFQCLSFGFFQHDIFYDKQQKKAKLTKKQIHVKQKLNNLGLDVNLQIVTGRKLQKVYEVLQDYKIAQYQQSQSEISQQQQK